MKRFLLTISMLLAVPLSAFGQIIFEEDTARSEIAKMLSNTDSTSFALFLKERAATDTAAWKYYLLQNSPFLNFQKNTKNMGSQLTFEMADIVEQQIERDFMGDRLKSTQMDAPGLISLSGLAIQGFAKLGRGKSAKRKVSELPMPTLAELKLLAVIWEKPNISDTELYSNLDSSEVTTFAMMRDRLDDLSRKGFITKDIISPQYPFDFITPFGTIRVEMSPKNRKNQEFAYTSLVDRKKLFEHVNTQYSLAALAENSKSNIQREQLRQLLHHFLQINQHTQ